MSTFVERMRREATEPRDYASYKDVSAFGSRAITLRLPVTTLAKVAALEERLKAAGAALSSRQELIFEMIESCVGDWVLSQPQSKQKGSAEEM